MCSHYIGLQISGILADPPEPQASVLAHGADQLPFGAGPPPAPDDLLPPIGHWARSQPRNTLSGVIKPHTLPQEHKYGLEDD